jgi:hypothetical protein
VPRSTENREFGGVVFLTNSYEAEWLHGKTLLDRIEEDKLAPEIAELTDAVVLPYVRSAQAAMGEALGVGESELDVASTTAMAEAITAMGEAVSDYVRVLAGETKRKDPESAARFEKAVAPLDRHREYHRPRARTVAEDADTDVSDDDPDAPVPPVDPVDA